MAKEDKFNEEAAPNNNLSSATLKFHNKFTDGEFAEELSDGGERNEFAKKQAENNQ